ncbi:MAG: multiheme c-type cytochrome [bacterium]
MRYENHLNKNLKALNENALKYIIVPLTIIYVLVALCNTGYCVDGGSGDGEGAHNQLLPGLQDKICSRCHFPKRGKGKKIWDDLPTGAETISGTKGMRTICQSCHYPGNAVNALSGLTLGYNTLKGHYFKNGNIYIDQSLSRKGEHHVMHDWASVQAGSRKLPAKLDKAFSLNKKDEWGLPKIAGDTTNSGVYCGTCHNQHLQPNGRIDGNGDYLRVKEGSSVGTSDNRTDFCIQCHSDPSHSDPNSGYTQHGIDMGCLTCHHPHDGLILIEDNPPIGQYILLDPIIKRNFRALPNVPSFGSQEEEVDNDISSICYGCHSPKRAFKALNEMGVAIIHGDDSNTPYEHHPMGSQALHNASPRASKIDYVSEEGQLTCISCHKGFHEGDEQHFLRDSFQNDDAYFCTLCHKDKTAEGLGKEPGIGHRKKIDASPNNRGNCMFCHFIHDGPQKGTLSSPSLSALIRVDPVNCKWAQKSDDNDTDDYEDICYGCHGNPDYMNSASREGSALLKPNKYASHIFSGRIREVSLTQEFPLSDGAHDRVLNDYGVPEGEIFCGSCHNIHNCANQPYLRGSRSAYIPDGFCEGCHTKNPVHGKSSHPIGVTPNPEITLSSFPELFYGRIKGQSRGRTANNTSTGAVICLTCHNIHTAVTDHKGQLIYSETEILPDQKNHGHLLIKDNLSSPPGSDLCLSCHQPYTGVIASRHDFSEYLSCGKEGGICSTCHTPHRAMDKGFLWCRSLKEERKAFNQTERPAYTLGATLYCYDCHDDEHGLVDNDPPKEAFFNKPQDIAFRDDPGRSGKVGYYETMPPGSINDYGVQKPAPRDGSNTGGHFIKTAHITNTFNGIETGDKLPCDLCHNPHNTNNNEVFLKNPLGVHTEDTLCASYNSRNGTCTGREICASCHGYSDRDPSTGTEWLPVRLYNMDIIRPIETISEHKSDPNYPTPCTDCHKHSRIITRASDRLGQAIWQTDLSQEDILGGNHTRNYHFTGLSGPALNKCTICHSMDLTFSAAGLVFNDKLSFPSTEVCHPCHSKGGQFNGLAMAKANWGASPYDADRNLKPSQDKWCAACHDDDQSYIAVTDPTFTAPNIAGNNKVWGDGFYETGHGLSPSREYVDSTRKGAGLICTNCHDANKDHINNEKYDASRQQPTLLYQNAYRLKKIDGRQPLTIPRTAEEYNSTDFNLCYSCHDEEALIGLGEDVIESGGEPVRYFEYSASDNHNPYPRAEEVKTFFKNVNSNKEDGGVNRHDPQTGDFKTPRPMSEFVPVNSHWNHLAYAYRAVVVEPRFDTGDRPERIQYCSSGRGCHNKILWDSDHDLKRDPDSRISCPACHNPHGTSYPAMTNNELKITHYPEGDPNWVYGQINGDKYGQQDPGNPDDLYCNECHAYYSRHGENYKYYPSLPSTNTSPKAFTRPMPPQ